MESLNEYAAAFRKALEEEKEFANFNRDIQHATIIVCTAMEYAKEVVRILSHKLDPMLYATPWFLEASEKFTGRGGSLRILVETEVDESHPVRLISERVTIRRVRPEAIKSYKFNFMVVDDKGFRFESDRDEPEALVSFHHQGKGAIGKGFQERMVQLFDSLWKTSS